MEIANAMIFEFAIEQKGEKNRLTEGIPNDHTLVVGRNELQKKSNEYCRDDEFPAFTDGRFH